jgi:hypothetical protein
MGEKAVLLNGSPRGKSGTSYQLAAYLGERLAAGGLEVTTLAVYKSLRTDQGRRELLRAVDSASVLALVTPLYIDCLPANIIRTLELIAGDRPHRPPQERPRLMAIVNCGFLESHQNDVALRILKRFAAESGFEWAGGLAVGGGGFFAGRPLKNAGAPALDMMRVLDLSAAALAAGELLPQEAQTLARKQRMPRWLYQLASNAGWWILARKHGVLLKLRARPYAKRQRNSPKG